MRKTAIAVILSVLVVCWCCIGATGTVQQDVYSMRLFQTIKIDRLSSITRVPGGWAYRTRDAVMGNMAVCFIPLTAENPGPYFDGDLVDK